MTTLDDLLIFFQNFHRVLTTKYQPSANIMFQFRLGNSTGRPIITNGNVRFISYKHLNFFPEVFDNILRLK